MSTESQCRSHDGSRGRGRNPILDPDGDHPLRNVFSVGAAAPADDQALAAEVVGFAIGDRVSIALARPSDGSGPRFHWQAGTVTAINPADCEIQVSIDGRTAPAWFCPVEVVPMPIRGARRALDGDAAIPAAVCPSDALLTV